MDEQNKDLFRDTWVRYLGYSNEVGESFRAIVPVNVVRATYGIAFAYVLADAADKSIKMIKKNAPAKRVLVETGDVLLWQTMASVIIPGITINRLCALSRRNLAKYASKVPVSARNIITVGIGLASIPIIIPPIDATVTILMDRTYRKSVTG